MIPFKHYVHISNDSKRITAWHHVETRWSDGMVRTYRWYPNLANLRFEQEQDDHTEWAGMTTSMSIRPDPDDLTLLATEPSRPFDIKLCTFDFTIPFDSNTPRAQWRVREQLPVMVKLMTDLHPTLHPLSLTYLGFYSTWTVQCWIVIPSVVYRVWQWDMYYYSRVVKVLSESTRVERAPPDLYSRGWVCMSMPLQGWGIPGLLSPVYRKSTTLDVFNKLLHNGIPPCTLKDVVESPGYRIAVMPPVHRLALHITETSWEVAEAVRQCTMCRDYTVVFEMDGGDGQVPPHTRLPLCRYNVLLVGTSLMLTARSKNSPVSSREFKVAESIPGAQWTLTPLDTSPWERSPLITPDGRMMVLQWRVLPSLDVV